MEPMEPRRPEGRLSSVTDETTHDLHEPIDVAALASGDLAGPDRDRVAATVASCRECAGLFEDLQALAAATRIDPPAIPARRIDFRLSDDDAARLASRRRRIASWLAGPRGTVTRPLATGLAALGVAAIVFSSVSLPLAGGAASGGSRVTDLGAESTQGLTPVEGPGVAPQNDASGVGESAGPSLGPVEPYRNAQGAPETTKALTTETPGPSALSVVGIVLLVAGIAVLAMRPLARRMT